MHYVIAVHSYLRKFDNRSPYLVLCWMVGKELVVNVVGRGFIVAESDVEFELIFGLSPSLLGSTSLSSSLGRSLLWGMAGGCGIMRNDK